MSRCIHRIHGHQCQRDAPHEWLSHFARVPAGSLGWADEASDPPTDAMAASPETAATAGVRPCLQTDPSHARASGCQLVHGHFGAHRNGTFTWNNSAMPMSDFVGAPAKDHGPTCDHVGGLGYAEDHDHLECTRCGFRISGEALLCLGFRHRSFGDSARQELEELNADRMRLADQLGTMRDENRDLAAENSRLRREVERLARKGGGR